MGSAECKNEFTIRAMKHDNLKERTRQFALGRIPRELLVPANDLFAAIVVSSINTARRNTNAQ